VVVAADTQFSQANVGAETRLAIDRDGNLYYLWLQGGGEEDGSGGKTLFLATSRDGGTTWSKPLDVGVPGLTAAKFPWIVAGDRGRIAFSYLGSKVRGGFDASRQDMRTARWDAYVGFSQNALDKRPVFATATANPSSDPLRRGPCSGRCEPDPTDCVYSCAIGSPRIGMYDYLQLALDPTSGRVAMSLVDLCAEACATGRAPSEWSFIGAVGVQVRGPSLLLRLST
jgi:hypothetical protein